MKSTRFIHSALVASILLAVPALRAGELAGNPAQEQRRERLREHLEDKLDLTAEQKTRMQAINQAQRAELEALKADTSLSKEDRRTKAAAIHEKYKAQRDAVLTPEQRAKADKMRAKAEKRREKRGN